MDNFDHNEATFSGMNSTHDSACVLFQNDSSIHIQNGTELSKIEKLPQTTGPIILPSDDYKITKKQSLSENTFTDGSHKQDNLWYMSRMD